MTDEELIQALQKCSDSDACEICDRDVGCVDFPCCEWSQKVCEEAADRMGILLVENVLLRKATEKIPQWLNVNERLPENKQDVLAISDDGVEVRIYPANYDRGKWFDCFFFELNRHTTHWMPLPEIPNEKERMQ